MLTTVTLYAVRLKTSTNCFMYVPIPLGTSDRSVEYVDVFHLAMFFKMNPVSPL